MNFWNLFPGKVHYLPNEHFTPLIKNLLSPNLKYFKRCFPKHIFYCSYFSAAFSVSFRKIVSEFPQIFFKIARQFLHRSKFLKNHPNVSSNFSTETSWSLKNLMNIICGIFLLLILFPSFDSFQIPEGDHIKKQQLINGNLHSDVLCI